MIDIDIDAGWDADGMGGWTMDTRIRDAMMMPMPMPDGWMDIDHHSQQIARGDEMKGRGAKKCRAPSIH